MRIKNIIFLVVYFSLFSCKKEHQSIPPKIKTDSILKIESYSATIASDLEEGTENITARGVCYSAISAIPTINDSLTSDSLVVGKANSIIDGLNPLKSYNVRAYAKTNTSIVYGNTLKFKTLSMIEDNTYHVLLDFNYTRNFWRDKAFVHNDSIKLVLYYQNTDSTTTTNYYPIGAKYPLAINEIWFKFKGIGSYAKQYVLIKGWPFKGHFTIKQSDSSYDDAYENAVGIWCSHDIE